MGILAERVDHVIGVDTHRDSHSAAIVTAVTGAVVEDRTVSADAFGHKRLLRFAKLHAKGRRVWAIESSGSYVGDARFLGRERQAHVLPHELCRPLFERLGLGFGATDQHHEVIRIADHPVTGAAVCPVACPLVVRARAPRVLEVTVEYREGNVRQAGRENRPLWRARWRRGQAAMLAHDPCGEESSDQRQDALVGHPAAHLFHQQSLMDLPEGRHDTLPISMASRRRSGSSGDGMRGRAARLS